MYQKTTLANGVQVVTETIPKTRSAALSILVNAGPQNDSVGQEGLAHLTEHLMFQGTSSRSAFQIANLMDMGGGHMGGFTTRDYTCYFATVLDDYYTYALDLFGDILLNSIFPADSLAKEKEAVLHEIHSNCDSPDGRIHTLLKANSWPNHSLGHPITGHPESVRALTREDVIYFVHENYTPNRIIVTAAGSINHDDFVAQTRDAFWRMMGSGKTIATSKPIYRQHVTVDCMPVSQDYFALAIPAFSYTHPDRYSLHILNNLLGGGISSRLFRRIREECGLVYSIGSEYHAYRDAGMLIIEGSTMPEHLMSVLALTLVELWKLIGGDEPVDPEELWKAKMQIRGQYLIAGENTSTRMSRLSTQELYFGNHFSADEILEEIDAVDCIKLQEICVSMVEGLYQTSVTVAGPHVSQHDVASIEKLLASFQ